MYVVVHILVLHAGVTIYEHTRSTYIITILHCCPVVHDHIRVQMTFILFYYNIKGRRLWHLLRPRLRKPWPRTRRHHRSTSVRLGSSQEVCDLILLKWSGMIPFGIQSIIKTPKETVLAVQSLSLGVTVSECSHVIRVHLYPYRWCSQRTATQGP